MKRYFPSLLIILICLVSCKKGDEDPALSLLSRKARLSGEWTITKIEGARYSGGSSEPYRTVEGSSTQIVTNSNISSPTTYRTTEEIVEYSFAINKDGTWKQVAHVEREDFYDNGTQRSTTSRTDYYTSQGRWSFMRKIKGEIKNKERVFFDVESDSNYEGSSTLLVEYYGTGDPDQVSEGPGGIYTNTYELGKYNFTVELVGLRNKEMKWRIEEGSTWFFTELDSSYSSSSEVQGETFFTWIQD